MNITLLRRIFFDLRWHLFGTCFVLFLFSTIWAKITDRFANEIIPALLQKMSMKELLSIIFDGAGKFLQTLLGGESMNFGQPGDIMTIHTIHPLVLIVISLWCVGKAASSIAGEIDKGTMELLLSQPIARWKIVTTHLVFDLLTLPLLFLSLFLGARLGLMLIPLKGVTLAHYEIVIMQGFCMAFCLTGLTTFISSLSRYRNRVLAWGVAFVLVFFLIHFLGQLWEPLLPFRPLSPFYYYQPQQVLLTGKTTVDVWGHAMRGEPVLLFVGILGYGLAIWNFQRKDIPAPI